MKKVLSIVLVVLLSLTLMVGVVGCGGNNDTLNGNNNAEVNDIGEVETNNDLGTGNDVNDDVNNDIAD